VDPILAVLIGLWVLPRTWSLLSESVNILLEGVPEGLSLLEIEDALRAVPGVRAVHDLHVWAITSGKNSLTTHLVLDGDAAGNEQRVLQATRSLLVERFGITHTTVQVEAERCDSTHDVQAPYCALDATLPRPRLVNPTRRRPTATMACTTVRRVCNSRRVTRKHGIRGALRTLWSWAWPTKSTHGLGDPSASRKRGRSEAELNAARPWGTIRSLPMMV
jgi:hypothetical protein